MTTYMCRYIDTYIYTYMTYMDIYIYTYAQLCIHTQLSPQWHNLPTRLSPLLYYSPCLACWWLSGSLVPAMCNHTSCAQCSDNQEGTLFSWLHICYTHLSFVRFEPFVCHVAMCNLTSCAYMHELPQNHSRDNTLGGHIVFISITSLLNKA